MAKLLFDSTIVGEIAKPLFCDQTWFGVLILDSRFESQVVAKGILAFKRFCEEWNERLGRFDEGQSDSPQEAPDANEFDQYRDLIESEKWNIEDDEGLVHHVNAPVFFEGGDFSCRPWKFLHPDQE